MGCPHVLGPEESLLPAVRVQGELHKLGEGAGRELEVSFKSPPHTHTHWHAGSHLFISLESHALLPGRLRDARRMKPSAEMFTES